MNERESFSFTSTFSGNRLCDNVEGALEFGLSFENRFEKACMQFKNEAKIPEICNLIGQMHSQISNQNQSKNSKPSKPPN